MKREWEIGRCIHNIYEPERALPGYMGTGEGVVTEDGNFVGAPAHCLLILHLMALACLLQHCTGEVPLKEKSRNVREAITCTGHKNCKGGCMHLRSGEARRCEFECMRLQA